MSSTVASFAQEQIRTDLPKFRTGSTVKVHYLIVEGATKRVQIFEGVVIYIKNASTSRTFLCPQNCRSRYWCRAYISAQLTANPENRGGASR